MKSLTVRDRGFRLGALAVAAVAFLPFVRMAATGQSLYFRDLSGQFFPARRFLLDGLLRGEWRSWNPFVHEGVPVALSAFAYPFDLLQLLIPNEFGISLSLALHIPLAAVSFVLMARALHLSPFAASAGALIYALGGFSLSTINLYVYVQTLAWAPLLILAFRRAVETGRPRAMALAALALAVTVSTTGIEIALQACLLAAVLTPPVSLARLARSSAIALLALGLAAATILPMLALARNSERGSGFATSVVLANSVHPLALVQVLVGGFFGDLSNLTGSWWGVNFFPRGFPYMLSLYLGPAALALAVAGALTRRPLRRRLVGLGVLALLACLGRYLGWGALFDLSPDLRFLRYPVKAFFTVQFCVALLASFGVDALATRDERVTRQLTLTSLAVGGLLVCTPAIPWLAPGATTWFLDGFLPPSVASAQRDLVMRFITRDAATGGAIAAGVGLLGWLVRRERLAAARAALAVVALLGADLIRTGAGLNPSVTTDFYSLSPEMSREAAALRRSGGRIFTCDPQSSQSYWQGRRARPGHHEAFTMAAMRETLTPDFNVPFEIKSALSIDRTMLAPTSRVMSPELAACQDLRAILPSLRTAGVSRVLSLDPLDDGSLRLLTQVSPAPLTPLTVHIYELTETLPRFNLETRVLHDRPDLLEVEVSSPEPARLVVREPFAPGWQASVNGARRAIIPSADGHREFSLAAGRSVVRMAFRPAGLRTGLWISAAAALGCLILLITTGAGTTPRSGEPPRSARIGHLGGSPRS